MGRMGGKEKRKELATLLTLQRTLVGASAPAATREKDLRRPLRTALRTAGA